MSDQERNPYAPPAEPVRAFEEPGPSSGRSDYREERRPVILCIGLTILTLSFYPTIWLIKRRPFLDRLDAPVKLGTGLPLFVLAAGILSFAVELSADAAPIRPLLSLMSGIATIIANFRVLSILRSDSARTGRFIEFSTLGTFFFGIYYLQYKVNQLADLPAHVSKPKRKKKKRKAAPAEDAADAAIAPALDAPAAED